jgi:hypothetical protein
MAYGGDVKTIRETKVKHNTLRLLATKDGFAGIVISRNGIKAADGVAEA